MVGTECDKSEMGEREMKKVLLLFVTMITASAFAVERKELVSLIEEASGKRESAYLEARGRIIAYGADALPLLADLAMDESLSWQQRLVSRICYERIERKDDIGKLLATDWYKHPKFNPDSHRLITGPEPTLGTIIIPEMKDAGLWYHCLEVVWKMTGEKGNCIGDADLWTYWCTAAVKDNPEERVWFLRVCRDKKKSRQMLDEA